MADGAGCPPASHRRGRRRQVAARPFVGPPQHSPFWVPPVGPPVASIKPSLKPKCLRGQKQLPWGLELGASTRGRVVYQIMAFLLGVYFSSFFSRQVKSSYYSQISTETEPENTTKPRFSWAALAAGSFWLDVRIGSRLPAGLAVRSPLGWLAFMPQNSLKAESTVWPH